VLVSGGRAVVLSGPIRCWNGGTVKLRATVSERSTRTQAGGIAEGFWTGRCTGNAQHWQLTATATDGTIPRAGCAHAVGLMSYGRYGQTVDVRQWLSTITLTTPEKARIATACEARSAARTTVSRKPVVATS
jgi:hypothetical protein